MAEALRQDVQVSSESRAGSERAVWVAPELTELPRLTELTLQTGIPIPGGGNTGGGTVF